MDCYLAEYTILQLSDQVLLSFRSFAADYNCHGTLQVGLYSLVVCWSAQYFFQYAVCILLRAIAKCSLSHCSNKQQHPIEMACFVIAFDAEPSESSQSV